MDLGLRRRRRRAEALRRFAPACLWQWAAGRVGGEGTAARVLALSPSSVFVSIEGAAPLAPCCLRMTCRRETPAGRPARFATRASRASSWSCMGILKSRADFYGSASLAACERSWSDGSVTCPRGTRPADGFRAAYLCSVGSRNPTMMNNSHRRRSFGVMVLSSLRLDQSRLNGSPPPRIVYASERRSCRQAYEAGYVFSC